MHVPKDTHEKKTNASFKRHSNTIRSTFTFVRSCMHQLNQSFDSSFGSYFGIEDRHTHLSWAVVFFSSFEECTKYTQHKNAHTKSQPIHKQWTKNVFTFPFAMPFDYNAQWWWDDDAHVWVTPNTFRYAGVSDGIAAETTTHTNNVYTLTEWQWMNVRTHMWL